MIQAYLYPIIYDVLTVVLTIILTLSYNSRKSRIRNLNNRTQDKIGFVISMALALFIGFRPMSKIFVDMVNYEEVYQAFMYKQPFEFDTKAENLIFDNLFAFLGAYGVDITVLFVIMAVLYFCVTFKALSLMFPSNALYAFVAFLGAFSTYSYSTNGVKAGVAATFFLLALACWNKKIWAIIFLLISLGFHHSMIMPVCAFILCNFVKSEKIYLSIWVIALIISAAHITFFQELFGSMADDQGAKYLTKVNVDWGGKTGFRYDFVLYSLLPIVVGWIAIFRRGLKSSGFRMLYNTYVLTNAIWLLCMYAAFTNRIAYLSWLMYPVVLVYPYLRADRKNKRYGEMNLLIWIQVLFSLFMTYVI